MIKLSQQNLLGISAALVVLMGITFFYAARQWYDDWSLTHHISIIPPKIKTDRAGHIIAALPNDHLFGKSFAKIGEVPTTNLSLSVTGIVKIEPEGNRVSKAYISLSGQPSKIYQKGDTLPSGVKIYDITTNAVILDNHGQLEKLPLPREKLQFKPRNTKLDLEE